PVAAAAFAMPAQAASPGFSSGTFPAGAMQGGPMQAGTVPAGGGDFARQLIAQQMQLMGQQLALLSGLGQPGAAPAAVLPAVPVVTTVPQSPAQSEAAAQTSALPADIEEQNEEAALAHTRYDVKKAFGAIARIDNNTQFQLSDRQREKLDAFIDRYVARTRKSRDYTQLHRPHMADPRVVNGFRPLLKEITYQIVIERSKGAHLQDLDGNDYVDALNGFGMSLFGWQPEFVMDAVRAQMELGYEIGPQHPLAGEVARLACEVTG